MTDVLAGNHQNGVVVVLNSTDHFYPYDRLGITYDSTDSEILAALAPIILEEEGFNIAQAQENETYTVKKVESSQMVYTFPKSTAGI